MIEKILGDTIGFLFTQGLLGIIAVIEGVIIYILDRRLREESREHLGTIKQFQGSVAEPLEKIQKSSDRIFTKMEQDNVILLNLLSRKK